MSPEQINNFFSFLYEGRLGEITFWLRLIAGVITSALAAAIVVIAVKFRELIARSVTTPAVSASLPAPEVPPGPWQEVMRKIQSESPADWNLAVIQADSILDGVLKDMGLSGETMGERLQQLNLSSLAALNDVWEAHKTRNRIVHETEPVLAYQEARRAVMLFEKALRELGYLQD